jgi:hypothetical protein
VAAFTSVTPVLFDAADGNIVLISIGSVNRLRDQFIRRTKIDCRYEIPGASPDLQIPTDSFPASSVSGPAFESPADDGAGGSTVPGTGLPESDGSVGRTEFPVIGTGVYAYIVNNQNLLPQLPFTLNATCSVTGVTQSGDTLTTNEVTLGVIFVDPSEIIPEPGSGGDIPGGDDDDASAAATASSEFEGEEEEDDSVSSDEFELKENG